MALMLNLTDKTPKWSNVSHDIEVRARKGAPPPKSVSFDEVSADIDNLEQSLAARSEMEMDFSDRLCSLAGETAHSPQSNPTTFGQRILSSSFSRASDRDTTIEDLERELKDANNQATARSDAFELIYNQWHLVQKELEQKKHEVESMKSKLRQKDTLIDTLQFKLIWMESDAKGNEGGYQREVGFFHGENDTVPLLRQSEEVRAPFDAIQSSSGDIFNLNQHAEPVPKELLCTPDQPRSIKVKSGAKTILPRTQIEKSRKIRGLFAGLYKKKMKKDNPIATDNNGLKSRGRGSS